MPSKQTFLERVLKRKKKEEKEKIKLETQICLQNVTRLHVFYQGPAGTKIVGKAGLIAILHQLYGPNFKPELFNKFVKNIRTGEICHESHHCKYLGDEHDPEWGCFFKGHLAFCLRYVNREGKWTRCLNRYAVHSKGCCDPAHENRDGTSAKIVENLFDDKLDEADWADFNDPQDLLIARHEEARTANIIDPHMAVKQDAEEVEQAVSQPQATSVRPRPPKPWERFKQRDAQTMEAEKKKADEEKQIKFKTQQYIQEQEDKDMAKGKGKGNKKQDPRITENLYKDARQRATVDVINENSIKPKTTKDEQNEEFRRQLSYKRRNGGRAPPKANTTKPGREVRETAADRRAKAKKAKRDQENQPPA